MATLFKRSNGIYYSVSFTPDGRRIWRSTRCRTKTEAKLALKRLAASRNHGRQPSSEHVTFGQFLPRFLDYARTNLAPTTVLLYQQSLKTFERLVGDFELRTYNVQDVESFKTKRLYEVSPTKVNIDFRSIRAFFEVARKWKLIDENPFQETKQIRVPPQTPTYITQEDFRKLLGVMTIPWFRELVVFAVCTMMRAGEIVSLTWENIDLNRRLILVQNTNEFRTKTTKPRAVPMNEWVFRFLATRVNKSGPIFTFPDGTRPTVGYVSQRFKKYIKKAGLPPKIHFHSLRHTGATWLVQGGVSIYAIQKLLGHSSIAVTQVYSHLEVDGLFQSVNRISTDLQRLDSVDSGTAGVAIAALPAPNPTQGESVDLRMAVHPS